MSTAIVGQEAAVKYHFGTHSYQFGYIVTKVTPGGQVVITKGDHERRFDKEGYEMGSYSSKYSRDTLVINVAEARVSVARHELCAIAAQKIRAVRVDNSDANYGKDGLTNQITKLQSLLDDAKAAVDAIF